jgi:DNA-binding MarR family transcriptional regulator
MATYLDLFAAVKRGIRYAADLAVELYYPQEAVDAATAALRDAGIVQFVQVEGRGTRIELTTAAADEASAVKKAKAAGFDLEAEIPGGS